MAAIFLSYEIIVGILSCLPVKSLIRFRCICKDWFDLIKSPSFVQIHLQRSTENGNFNLIDNSDGLVYSLKNPNFTQIHLQQRAIGLYESHEDDEVEQIIYPYDCSLQFMGSCNGLIYLTVSMIPGRLFCLHDINGLWNPSTQEYFELRNDNDYYPQDYGYAVKVTCGFGYDLKNKDYKVVMIVHFSKGYVYHHTIVKVYTLGSNSWKRIEDIPYELIHKTSPGMYVNGSLHWVAKRANGIETSSEKLLISFGLGDEEFQEVPQPDYLDNNFDMDVGVLEGNLCIILTDRSKTHVEIWMMKEYGVRESWNKLLSITQSMGIRECLSDLTPIKILRNGEILLNSRGLMSYDPRNKIVKRLDIPKINSGYPRIDVVAYVGSLISLNSDKYYLPKEDMDFCELLLGRPWKFDIDITYRGRANIVEFDWKGKIICLQPMSITKQKDLLSWRLKALKLDEEITEDLPQSKTKLVTVIDDKEPEESEEKEEPMEESKALSEEESEYETDKETKDSVQGSIAMRVVERATRKREREEMDNDDSSVEMLAVWPYPKTQGESSSK